MVDPTIAYGYIYMTVNCITGDRYIGQHKIHTRNRIKEYIGSGTRLRKAIKKYGRESFKKTIIEYCLTRCDLDERERYWITFYNAQKDPRFYNIAEGGMAGNIWDGLTKEEQDAVREKIRENNARRDYSDYKKIFSGSGNPSFGRHWYKDEKNVKQYYLFEDDPIIKELGLVRGMFRTEEHNKKISISNKGKPHKSPSSGNVCIHKDGHNKYVKADEVKKFLQNGWELGGKRFVGATRGWIKMNNGKQECFARNPEHEKELLKNGYVRGMLKIKRKKRRTKKELLRDKKKMLIEKYKLTEEDL